MLLYKYSTANSVNILSETSVVFTPPEKFNDPFEFLPVLKRELTDAEAEKYLMNRKHYEPLRIWLKRQGIYRGNKDRFKDFVNAHRNEVLQSLKHHAVQAASKMIDKMVARTSTRFGVLCLSSLWNHPLLWAHYADAFQGLCFGLEIGNNTFPDTNPQKVAYSDKRVVISPVSFLNHSLPNPDTEKIILTKSKVWEYESEYRILIDLQYCSKQEKDGHTLYRRKIPPRTIREVTLGLRASPTTEAKVRELLQGNQALAHVKLYRLKISDEAFSLLRDPA